MSTRWSRRQALKACLLPAGAIGAHWLLGCSDDPASSGAAAGTTGSSANTAGSSAGTSGAQAGSVAPGGAGAGAGNAAFAQAGSSAGAGSAAGSSGAGTAGGAAGRSGAGGMLATSGSGGLGGSGGAAGVAGSDVPWATGGTKSMMGGYPDPFTGGSAGTACVLYPAQTLGPCYAAMPDTLEDISDGLTGLPVRLSFLVVRGDGCTPVPNATVDIWHSGFNGIYSAFATGTVCNPSTMEVRSEMFCRGIQTANAQGRVDFSTIFPGWYTGRTIHIHFTVRVDGRAAITSQLYFEDALSDEILGQGEYAARGRRDTTNTQDSTFRSGGARPEQVIMSSAKRPDGVLHAWKVLSIA